MDDSHRPGQAGAFSSELEEALFGALSEPFERVYKEWVILLSDEEFDHIPAAEPTGERLLRMALRSMCSPRIR